MSHFNLVCHMTTTFIVTMLACPGKDKTSTGRTTTNVNLICSRNYRFYRNGNSANLFSYACKGKDFSRFVYLYLKQNSCQCLIFVFYASRYRLWIRCDVCQQNKKPEESYAVSDVKHRHSNSVANLILQCINKKHSFTSYPVAKHQNTANLGLQTYQKNQWPFFMCVRRLQLAP